MKIRKSQTNFFITLGPSLIAFSVCYTRVVLSDCDKHSSLLTYRLKSKNIMTQIPGNRTILKGSDMSRSHKTIFSNITS
jgi:hypothetical protein